MKNINDLNPIEYYYYMVKELKKERLAYMKIVHMIFAIYFICAIIEYDIAILTPEQGFSIGKITATSIMIVLAYILSIIVSRINFTVIKRKELFSPKLFNFIYD